MEWTTEFTHLGTVLLAGALGSTLGLERELSGKPAGLRTHVFVCAGSALLMILSELIVSSFLEASDKRVSVDPNRIVQAIVVGISFLGAGTIIHERGQQVEGLTTAASIFLTAGIGIAVATQHYVLAVGTAGFAVTVLVLLGWIERRILQQESSHE
ncbi:MAG: MgtC/SapB family protein [Planctomycetales bacterium]|nr:MgtC/SapB family protein [Planctomycetales bacterium]